MACQRAMSPVWRMRQVYALHPSKYTGPDGAPNITPDVKTKIFNASSAKGFSTVWKIMDLDT